MRELARLDAFAPPLSPLLPFPPPLQLGLFGEEAKPVPPKFKSLLALLIKNYNDYMAAIGPDEIELKRKVQFEAGKELLVIRQRVGNLGDEVRRKGF